MAFRWSNRIAVIAPSLANIIFNVTLILLFSNCPFFSTHILSSQFRRRQSGDVFYELHKLIS